MAAASDTLTQWLTHASIPERALTPEQRAVLQAAFHFRQQQGTDYYASRLLGHFLLHAHTGLKVAQIARLVGVSRPTASRQQKLSAKQAIQQAHHRMDGRPYGKLLPRYAGPLAQFLLGNPDATRADLIDFLDRTFGVRVSRIALYKFLKKFGLDAATLATVAAPPPVPTPAVDRHDSAPPLPLVPVSARLPATSAPPFCADARSSPAPSC